MELRTKQFENKVRIVSRSSSAIGKSTIAESFHAFFPITKFHHFHRDVNINYELNRFLIPRLEDVFAGIGRQIENYEDWKRLFLATAPSFEAEGHRKYPC